MASIVVLWGAVQSEVPTGARIDSIEFIAGKDLLGWFARRDGDAVDKAAALDLLQRIEAFRASSWPVKKK